MKAIVIIVIIAHKEHLAEYEKNSLMQCFKVLNRYPIKLICPEGLNISEYQYLVPGIAVEFIDPKWQVSYEAFNRLKRDVLLYRKFKNYENILFYELDAWVFKDELMYWCNKRYDYVGAPWSGMHIYKELPLLGVGNGGLSLRNVKSAVNMLKQLRLLEVLEEYKNFNWRGIITRLPFMLYKLFIAKNRSSNFEKNYTFQEDVFWCKDASARLKGFTCTSSILKLLGKILLTNRFDIAPVDIASEFSIETNPRHYYKLNNEMLPFGCHAWEKYDPDFWAPFIYLNTIKHNKLLNEIS